MYICIPFYRLSLKGKLFRLFSLRFLTKSSRLFENKPKASLPKTKRKLTVIRNKIPATRDSISPIEWRTAESVMKRLNWENKQLFGPVQSSKTTNYDDKKFEESNQIIQHVTQIPIIEPCIEQSVSLKSTPNVLIDKSQSLNINSLLSFPLVNKPSLSSKLLNNKINEWNSLRKDLECMSKSSSIPSVSAILEKTMPKERVEILERWKQNMIKQLGEEGFQKYHKELLSKGDSLHNSINTYLASTRESELVIREENAGHWRSLKQIFPSIKDVKLLEEFVTHPFLCYRGVVDCFARYNNQLVVIDWKTSKKPKTNIKSTYDNPLQIAAYVGALNFDPKYQYLASKGLIVVAYESGGPATAHFIDEGTMLEYWNHWLLRVKEFWDMKRSEITNSCK